MSMSIYAQTQKQLFADATGGAVVIEKNTKGAILQVLTERLKKCYPYQWDVPNFGEMSYLSNPTQTN